MIKVLQSVPEFQLNLCQFVLADKLKVAVLSSVDNAVGSRGP